MLVKKIESGFEKVKPNKLSKIESIMLTKQSIVEKPKKKKCCKGEWYKKHMF